MKNLNRNFVNIGARTEVQPHEISLLKGIENYTMVHFTNGRHLLVATSLKKLEARLIAFNFFRTHKTFLVNIDCVKRFYEYENMVQMNDNQRVTVARRRTLGLKRILFSSKLND